MIGFEQRIVFAIIVVTDSVSVWQPRSVPIDIDGLSVGVIFVGSFVAGLGVDVIDKGNVDFGFDNDVVVVIHCANLINTERRVLVNVAVVVNNNSGAASIGSVENVR